MNKKRIVLLTIGSPDKFINISGGAEKSTLLLSSELIKNNYHLRILAFGKKNKIYDLIFNNINISVEEVKVPFYSVYFPILSKKLIYNKILSYSKMADVLHFYNVSLDPIAGLLKYNYPNLNIVSTLNSYYYTSPNFECRLWNNIKYKYNFLEKHIAFFELLLNTFKVKALLLIPVIPFLVIINYISIKYSKFLKNYSALSNTIKNIYELNGFRNITVIPNMFDISFENNEIIEKEKRILFVGRIKKTKGVENLIKAFIFSGLKTKGYSLIIAGGGPLLEKYKKKYNDSSIIFTGNIEYSSLCTLYKQSEIFVHPGIWPEPFGRTILEAIQNGCKMLVSDIGEPPNIVKYQECIFKHDSIKDLKEKLKLIANGNYGIVDRGILNNYTPEIIIDKFNKIYLQNNKEVT